MELEFLKDLLASIIHLDYAVVEVDLVGVEVRIAFIVEMVDYVLDGTAADVFGGTYLMGVGVD
jgi:hypothetical protein